MMKKSLLVLAVCVTGDLFAAEVSVRAEGRIITNTDGETFVATTPASGQVGVPADMPMPEFWLDASDTENWTKVAEGNYTRVKTVPSKGTSMRYATTDVSKEAGDTWYGWQVNASTLYAPRMPYLIDDADLLPGKALDFVAPGSTGYAPRMGLVFNKVSSGGGTSPSNELYNIGTVIAVFGSHDGRGWFLGGDFSTGGYGWSRGEGQTEASAGAYTWMNPMIRSFTGNSAQASGVLRHDGLPTNPQYVGSSHKWEILSWSMKTATARATGVGLGDARGAGFERTGQVRIAEMLIFTEILPKEMIEKVEAYLDLKWFGRRQTGLAGNARLGRLRSTHDGASSDATGIATILGVPADEMLTIDRLEGGRGLKSRVEKAGAGKLVLHEAAEYAGTIALKGGTLEVPLKEIPTDVSDIVTNCYLHVDASVEGAVLYSEEGEKKYVMGWNNLADGTYKGKKVMLAPIAANRRPFFMENALGEGKHVVDLGAIRDSNTNDGRYLSFTTAAAETEKYPGECGIDSVVTVVAAFGAHSSGFSIFNREPWSSAVTSRGLYNGWQSAAMLPNKTFDEGRGLSTTNITIYANGVRLAHASGFIAPDYQVMALRHPSVSGVARLGCHYNNSHMGGAQLAEIYVFRRQLTDDEMNDLSAYLAWKWYGTVIAGYKAASAPRKAPMLNAVSAESESTLNVPSATTLKVGMLEVSAPLSVRGGGTLEVGTLKGRSDGVFSATGTTVKVTGPMEPDSAATFAANPAFHLDPTNPQNLAVETEGGVDYVARVRDESMIHQLWTSADTRRPWLDTTVHPQGLPVLNFGAFGYYGRLMAFDRPIDSVMSVYAVWAPMDDSLSFMFGSTDRINDEPLAIGNLYDYHRHTEKKNGVYPLLYNSERINHVKNGEIIVDGVVTNRAYLPKIGELQLVEMHHLAPAYIAALATDRVMGSYSRNGGSCFGETLIYTRRLSAREKVATRNYLLKKWFGKNDSELENLPPPEETDAGTLAGRMDLVKDGANTMNVADLSGLTGTVEVAAGALRLTRPMPKVSPQLVTDGLVFHVDANVGVELVEGSPDSVREWKSTLNDGWSAVSANALTPVTADYPTLKNGMMDGTPFVCIPHGKYYYMAFCKDGVKSRIKNIRTVFWVFGTDDGTGNTLGGGFLLGGGNASNPDTGSSQWNWHRGGSNAGCYRSSYKEPLTCGSAPAAVRDGKWYMDGELVDGYTACPGSNQWHCITAVPVPNSTQPPSADGFAFDGRWFDGDAGLSHRTGGQSLAEVLIYDRTLNDDERAAVEAYLAAKWGFTQKGAVSAATVDLAEGATLDCGGHVQKLAAVTGSGSVVNGSLAFETLVADGAATAWPTLESCTISDGQVVELRNIPADPAGKSVKVLSADAFEGSEFLRNAVFSGEVPDPKSVRTRLQVDGNDLVVTFKAKGMMMIVR